MVLFRILCVCIVMTTASLSFGQSVRKLNLHLGILSESDRHTIVGDGSLRRPQTSRLVGH
jgi:hypothetical protein